MNGVLQNDSSEKFLKIHRETPTMVKKRTYKKTISQFFLVNFETPFKTFIEPYRAIVFVFKQECRRANIFG